MDDGASTSSTAWNEKDAALLQRLAARVTELEEQIVELRAMVWREGGEQKVSAPPPPAPPPPALPPLPAEWPSAMAAQVVRLKAQRPEEMPGGEDRGADDASPVSRAGAEAGAREKSLEDRLGSQLFNLIGIVALIFGSAWALKLAIDEGWLGYGGRIVIGLAAGAGLIAWSESFRRKGLAAFSYSLKAVGTAVLYLALWAAFQLYHLLPAGAALALMIGVTAWNAFMALTQDAELLAAYALVGALLTPVLLSTGGDHETFLLTYLAAIDLGVVGLQRFKAWARLLVPAYGATILYFIGYYSSYFHMELVDHSYRVKTAGIWDGQSTETALFALIFFALFALVSLKFWTRGDEPRPSEASVIAPVLIPLTNAAFVALALYSVWADSGLYHQVAWLMVLLAAVFLGLIRLQRTTVAAAMYLTSAIVCLTIAIPLKLSGQSLTTAWLIEGLILYWAATKVQAESKAAVRTLGVLAVAGYGLGLLSVFAHWTWNWAVEIEPPFFSADLGSALVAVAVLAGAAWLASRRRGAGSGEVPVLLASLSAIDLIALLLTLRELGPGWESGLHRAGFANSDFATALVGLLLLAGTSWAAWQADGAGSEEERKVFRVAASVDVVLFNLVALFTVEREIVRLFSNAEAGLQRSLALSGFLMAYGAALLAIGFWRRSPFLRWQALVLLLFTIAKVFLYDISGLSAGYRVVSFLALGALLMTISFAYQKDWLGLKAAPAASGDER